MDELARIDALTQAEWVRDKKISPAELVEAAITRIEKLNPQVNAVVTPLFERARAESRGPIPSGPFAGVPFLLKDLGALLKGVPWTAGSKFLKGFVPDHDSVLTQRYQRAGLIFLGRTNTCELGQQPTTEPQAYGPTRNPWNLQHTVGGSSGGSAAAVASGMVAVAHGNDGGGSIRIPASCCGIFGMKPTRGRITLSPDLGDILGGFVAEHALSRSVRDSAALLDATAGPDWGDPYYPPEPSEPYLQSAAKDPKPLRIAWTVRAPNGVPVHPDCVAAVQDAVRLLGEFGHELEEKNFAVDEAMLNHAFLVAWTSGAANGFANITRATGREPTPEYFEAFTWALKEWGLKHSAVDYLQAVRDLQFISRQIMRPFQKYDCWLTPTLGEPPLKIGELDSPPEDPLRGFFRASTFCPFTPVCNITGQPAMSVPLFWNAAGLPIGVHLMGRYGDENTLFRLAGQLERARPWAKKIPPLFA